jgi:hypothetical protein
MQHKSSVILCLSSALFYYYTKKTATYVKMRICETCCNAASVAKSGMIEWESSPAFHFRLRVARFGGRSEVG